MRARGIVKKLYFLLLSGNATPCPPAVIRLLLPQPAVKNAALRGGSLALALSHIHLVKCRDFYWRLHLLHAFVCGQKMLFSQRQSERTRQNLTAAFTFDTGNKKWTWNVKWAALTNQPLSGSLFYLAWAAQPLIESSALAHGWVCVYFEMRHQQKQAQEQNCLGTIHALYLRLCIRIAFLCIGARFWGKITDRQRASPTHTHAQIASACKNCWHSYKDPVSDFIRISND